MKIFALSILFMVSSAPVYAESVKLTYVQITTVSQGLSSLDGYQRVVKSGTADQVVPTPYDFAVGTRVAIASDAVSLQPILTAQQSELRALARSLGTAVQTPGSPEQAQFNDAAQKISEKSFDIDLVKFDVGEFNLAKNAIPPSVLSALAPIINDLMPKPEPPK